MFLAGIIIPSVILMIPPEDSTELYKTKTRTIKIRANNPLTKLIIANGLGLIEFANFCLLISLMSNLSILISSIRFILHI